MRLVCLEEREDYRVLATRYRRVRGMVAWALEWFCFPLASALIKASVSLEGEAESTTTFFQAEKDDLDVNREDLRVVRW